MLKTKKKSNQICSASRKLVQQYCAFHLRPFSDVFSRFFLRKFSVSHPEKISAFACCVGRLFLLQNRVLKDRNFSFCEHTTLLILNKRNIFLVLDAYVTA
jgi:hypothetical protein